MGAAGSRELEQAQGQVKRFAAEMQRLTTSLQAKESALGAVAREVTELRAYKEILQTTKRELDASAAELRAERRKSHDLTSMRAELESARGAARRESTRVAELHAELSASKSELEDTLGKLKFAQQEADSIATKRGTSGLTDEQKNLQAAKEEAALVTAQIVAEVFAPSLLLLQ